MNGEQSALPVTVVASSDPIIGYAFSYNRVPSIFDLEVRNDSGEDLDELTMVVQIKVEGVPIADDHAMVLDRIPAHGVWTLPRPMSFRFDHRIISRFEEGRRGELVLTISSDDGRTLVARRDVGVLAANQWFMLRDRRDMSMETLAAFVQPREPMVAEVLKRASGILEKTTDSSSLEGYQSGPARAAAIAQAIYMALASWGISYADPPASWDLRGWAPKGGGAVGGQKIRSPREVLSTKLGTCLDTSVLLASCLEEAGLLPTIWMVDGHAFVACWLLDRSELGAAFETSPGRLLNAYADHLLLVMESTGYSTGQDFGQASRRTAQKYLENHPEEIMGVIDVFSARIAGVVPLPVTYIDDDGQVVVVEYHPPAIQLNLPDRQSEDGTRQTYAPAEDATPPRIRKWKNSLLDLSLFNRLINYNQERHGLQIAVAPGLLAHLEDELHRGAAFTLRGRDDIPQIAMARDQTDAWTMDPTLLEAEQRNRSLFTALQSKQLPTRLRKVMRDAKGFEDETGANNLFICLGMLNWSLDGRPLKAPLILVPARLKGGQRGREVTLQIEPGALSTPNYSLLEKIKQSFGVNLDEFTNMTLDDAGVDVDGTLAALHARLEKAGLDFSIHQTANLALLDFSKFRLWRDLDESWPLFMENALVRHLVTTPTLPFEEPLGDEAPTVTVEDAAELCPIPADGSQSEAVAMAVQGRTFVIEGPPGTGKSQTITNMLAAALAKGKKVLFVAEKRAALDVVIRRMDEAGLGTFCLDVHAKGSKPEAVRVQLIASLNHVVNLDKEGLEVAQLQRTSARRDLQRYAERLHEPNTAAFSMWTARDRLLSCGEGPVFDVPVSALSRPPEVIRAAQSALAELPELIDLTRPRRGHPWSLANATSMADIDRDVLCAQVERLTAAFEEGGPQLAGVLNRITDAELWRAVDVLVDADLADLDGLAQAGTPAWDAQVQSLFVEADEVRAATTPLVSVFTPGILLAPLDDLAAQGATATSGFALTRSGRLKAFASTLAPFLVGSPDPKSLPFWVDQARKISQQATDLGVRLAALPGVRYPAGLSVLDPAAMDLLGSEFARARTAGDVLRDPGPAGELARSLRGADLGGLNTSIWLELSSSYRSFSDGLGTNVETFERWLDGRGVHAAMSESVPIWRQEAADRSFVGLARYLDLNRALEPLRELGLEPLCEGVLSGTADLSDAELALRRGVATRALEERRRSTGLEGFDGKSHDRRITGYVAADKSLRKLLRDSIPDQLLAQRPFNRDAQRGDVGALVRELNRQRNGLSVRALLARFPNVIAELTPCFMMSPDSVARFLAPGTLTFDLVIFDEASQIRVAESVGAMGRARAVVVAGDSKQMPPSSFGFASAMEDDDEDERPDPATWVPEDQESILSECVDAQVPRTWLSWHYRSQDEALIAFSNKRYYESRLSSFPTPVGGRGGTGLQLKQVNGSFDRTKGPSLRTNRVEAEAIVAEIARRVNDPVDRQWSIGVVTFNMQQQALISQLLDNHPDQTVVDHWQSESPDKIFVKNLESVQGDERDVIMFSLAFSPNEKGNVPLNWGPLTLVGGERRLNVAITRARRLVMIFASFAPSQLHAENSVNAGLRDMRAYLEMALEGPAVGAQKDEAAERTDRHRDEVAAALRERGLLVETNVGLSDFRVDLAVSDPEVSDESVCAVLLDGPPWASRRTVDDRDRLPADVLKGLMGWRLVARVWLPDWLRDAEGVADDLAKAVRDAARVAEVVTPPVPVTPVLEEPDDRELVDAVAPVVLEFTQAASSAPPDVSLDDPTATQRVAVSETSSVGRPSTGRVYVPWPRKASGAREVLDMLPAASAVRQVRAVAGEIIEAEGPVHQDRLAKMVGGYFGLDRVRSDRVAAILDAVPRSYHRRGSVDFLWPEGIDPKEWREFRSTPEGSERTLDLVAPEEVANAMAAIITAGMGSDQETLLRDTAEVFGAKRLTEKVRAALDLGIAVGLESGLFRTSDGARFDPA